MVGSVASVLHKLDSVVCCIPPPTEDEAFDGKTILEALGKNGKCRMFFGSYTNLPTEEIVCGSQLMAEIAESLSTDDLLIVCLTGGGSALLTLPVEFQSKQICLDALLQTTKLLSQSGADICELNSVRSCLDKLKAGGLASLAYPAQVLTLIISDVIGDPLNFIASGPTVIANQPPWKTRLEICLTVLEQYKLLDKIPEVVRKFLESERSNPTRPEPVNDKVDNWILGNNRVALEAAADSLRKVIACPQIYLKPIILATDLNGDSTKKGKILGEFLWSIALHLNWLQDHSTEITTCFKGQKKLVSPYEGMLERLNADLVGRRTDGFSLLKDACYDLIRYASEMQDVAHLALAIMVGGETTTVNPFSCTSACQNPVGGRCSHMALAAAIRWYEMTHDSELEGSGSRYEVALLAAASDGVDGPSAGGAGVWVASRMEPPIIDNRDLFDEALNALNKTDSYGFFRRHAASCIIPAKLTGTNVMDIFIGVAIIHVKLAGTSQCN